MRFVGLTDTLMNAGVAPPPEDCSQGAEADVLGLTCSGVGDPATVMATVAWAGAGVCCWCRNVTEAGVAASTGAGDTTNVTPTDNGLLTASADVTTTFPL